ncbi:hypothetical protein [Halovulum sp. GXIMD14793]
MKKLAIICVMGLAGPAHAEEINPGKELALTVFNSAECKFGRIA